MKTLDSGSNGLAALTGWVFDDSLHSRLFSPVSKRLETDPTSVSGFASSACGSHRARKIRAARAPKRLAESLMASGSGGQNTTCERYCEAPTGGLGAVVLALTCRI